LTFVVLGNRGVGKTLFVNNALEQQKSSGTPLSSSKVSLGGSLYRIQLVETTFDVADFNSSRQVLWPKYLNGIPFPAIHGAFCLYDVTDEDSVAQIPQALGTYNQATTFSDKVRPVALLSQELKPAHIPTEPLLWCYLVAAPHSHCRFCIVCDWASVFISQRPEHTLLPRY
jgi:hypothetical protein